MDTEHRREIEAFVAAAREATGEPIEEFYAFSFGDSPSMANELAALVVAGRKRATASLLAAYEADGEELPKVGAYSVVLAGGGLPAALTRTTAVTITPFREVGEDFARDEGEGDLSLTYWRDAHRSFFARTAGSFDEDLPVVCERFELVYPCGARAYPTDSRVPTFPRLSLPDPCDR